jgi:hypothetical protein
MPELRLGSQIRAYGSETVLRTVQSDSRDFAGLGGPPVAANA